MINVSAWAIRRPLPALMIFFVLCVAGLWGFWKLPVARFPDIAFPMVTVTVPQPGASPSQLETEVTRRVEDQVATLSGVKRVISTVTEGASTTVIEFELETPLETALDDTRAAVARRAIVVRERPEVCWRANQLRRSRRVRVSTSWCPRRRRCSSNPATSPT